MYKNRLNQYAQRKNLSFPVYTCEMEGALHAPRFKSRVSFHGKSYETVEFFPTLKEAEHAAAKVVCMELEIDDMQQDQGLVKSSLDRLTQKRGLCPTYKTVRSGPPHMPIFVSTLKIGSDKFHGDEAKSKKLAEINAATAAYCALTESSLMTECSKVSSSMKCVASDLTVKRDEFAANEETEVNAKRVKCSPGNEKANLPSLLPPEVSSAQVEHQTVTDPIAGQHEA